jgi:hypothetical protein
VNFGRALRLPIVIEGSRNQNMSYSTRVLSKNEDFPTFEELAQGIAGDHPDFVLTVEEGDEEEWQSLLLASVDGVEVAVLERCPVTDGSLGQDEIADFLEDLADAKPENNVAWLEDYLDEVRTVYVFEHLQGAETMDGLSALHGLRATLMDRGEAILQADGEGFTNEAGFHVVWQFSDAVAGPWNMGVLQDGVWHQFAMDLGDPDHRAAFLAGEVPADVSSTIAADAPE